MKEVHNRIEEMILISIIFLNVLDFFKLISGDISFLKLIISWSVLGYLIYRVGITEILTGKRNKTVDLFILLSYFLLIFDKFFEYIFKISEANAGNFSGLIFESFYNIILSNKILLMIFFTYIGFIFIFLLSLYLSYRSVIYNPSLLSAIGEEGSFRSLGHFFVRFIKFFLILLSFFLIVFNFFMEWLAMIIDAPIAMVGILFYLFIVIRHHQKFDTESIIYKAGNFGESFYANFIGLFKYKKGIILGVSGILVLHLLSDIGSYMLPYLFSFGNIFRFESFYFNIGDSGHMPFFDLFINQVKANSLSIFDSLFLLVIMVFNILGILFLLLYPSYIWYTSYSQKKRILSKTLIAVFFSSLFIFFLAPLFRISSIINLGYAGVNIQTTEILGNIFFPLSILTASALIIFAIFFFMSRYVSKILTSFITAIVNLFFMYYIYMYSFSTIVNYLGSLNQLWFSKHLLFVDFYSLHIFLSIFGIIIFSIFGIITVLFYLVGFILFIYEIYTRKRFSENENDTNNKSYEDEQANLSFNETN